MTFISILLVQTFGSNINNVGNKFKMKIFQTIKYLTIQKQMYHYQI